MYFAWGDTQGYTAEQVPSKKAFSWDDYKYGNGGTFTKYNNTDGKVKLEPADDAATAAMGGLWHMPSQSQYQELSDECYWEWTNSYNNSKVKGWIVYKVKDEADKGKKKTNSGGDTPVGYSLSVAHIFFPAAGYCEDGNVCDVGYIGCCWSRSLYTDGVDGAWYLNFNDGNVDPVNGNDRYYGCSVRGVFGR